MTDSNLCREVFELIAGLERERPCRRYFIGYSGGVDSHVLLHCCACSGLKNKITAVYIHHGLQSEADAWERHCQETAKRLAVDFLALRVDAAAKSGESPEEAARNARYRAFESLMAENDVLLLAQHREDQLETVLLQLFRGSGLRGLSAMPQRQIFGGGVILRPLLTVSKQAVTDYAAVHRLSWVEDPSNQSNDYDRNFLRNAVVPLLKQRWPSVDKTVSRSAKHCADAQRLLDELAGELFDPLFDNTDQTLLIDGLLAQSAHRQPLLIRHWFYHLGLKMPSLNVVERILTEVAGACVQRDPVVAVANFTVRRYRNKLYCLPKMQAFPLQDCEWPPGYSFVEVGCDRVLFCIDANSGIAREQWQNARVELRFRQGGEKIALPGRQGSHSLKNLFQEAGVPPWERAFMPLIYLDGRLAAVGDRWIASEFYCEHAPNCVKFSLQRKTMTDQA